MVAVGQGIGIDLGSKYSRVGVWQNDRVEIVPSKSGDRFTPTVVAFTEDKVLIGEPATQQLLQNTQNTIFDFTGRKFSDPEVQAGIKTWPFEVARGPDDKPLVVVKKFKGKTKSYQPVEILAMLLSELREVAETHTGKKIL
ncbi:hypothetical protein PF005_g19405 [Phytophthora fragariae]|uniref:Uncharacterized protein n=2 Tax=Phytophthora TaxID=4783 RepID=A0A6A3R3H6_9STRA|nr:hypothetical protein PF003_g7842 [Phytophthora fragariae]KAE8996061.1 hypothetical protein PR001_g19955 [Phytophthora rubi]KAE8942215.1 hypothetical protein PF009_g8016 [Phytophthora fragariae]KAE9006887.1 hypothetical protein PR002_g16364 [Phytophthora rubi]KAE9015420.1 hypothetical protein PF011_g7624 [Phytophthora fragariae]